MHPELVAISAVWQPDHLIDTLKAEHEALSAAVAGALREQESAAGAVREAVARLEALRKEERTNAREIESYTQKRDVTLRMIETGTAPDYAAAERQLQSCRELVDQYETRALELMEAIDGVESERRAGVERERRAAVVLEDARAALKRRDAPLRAEMAAAIERRNAAWAALPAEYRGPYAEQRRKKRPAMVNSHEGACAVCGARIAPQRLVETQLARAVHTCVGCGAWILP